MNKKLFECTRCGFCCHGETTVSLDDDDQKSMIQTLKISKDEALRKYWIKTKTEIQMKTVDGHCVFYDEGCTVHSGRPWRCRQWPLVDAILIDKVNLDSIRQSCPGIDPKADYHKMCQCIRDGAFYKKAKPTPEGK